MRLSVVSVNVCCELTPIITNGESIERVDCSTFLGTIISSDLGLENNTDTVVNKFNKGCSSCAK